MRKKLKKDKNNDDLFHVPFAIQDEIPINKISKKGIFEIESGEGLKIYDKAYLFTDINYYLYDEEEQEQVIEKYKNLLNSLKVNFKVIICKNLQNTSELNKTIYRKAIESDYKELSDAFNQYTSEKVYAGMEGLSLSKYFIISTEKNDYSSAESFFASLEGRLIALFKKLGSGLIPLTCEDRLRSLHGFYRMGYEKDFSFSWEESLSLGRDWRRDIINTAQKIHSRYITMDYGKRYVSTYYISEFPSELDDTFIWELSQVDFPIIVTIDVTPISKNEIQKILKRKYTNVNMSIAREQEVNNKAGYFSNRISFEKTAMIDELEEYMEQLRGNDENVFDTSIIIALSSESLDELNKQAEEIDNICNTYGLTLSCLIDDQREGLKSVLPTSARFLHVYRPLFTSALSGFTPFNVIDINDKDGFFYGINQVSKKGIFGNRKKYQNGNGFFFGISGSGKSMNAKMEMDQVLCRTMDDVLIIDPMGEYRENVINNNGYYYDFEKNGDIHINPLHVHSHISDKDAFISQKAEFLYAFCEETVYPDRLSNKHINMIDKACIRIYEDYFKSDKKESPTLITFRNKLIEIANEDLEDTKSSYAKDLADELEAITNGTLSVFCHQQTAVEKRRITAYNFSKLGNRMKKLAMIVALEDIMSNILFNQTSKTASWVYIDEIQEFKNNEYAMNNFENLWREVRKLGGLCTGMAQNILSCIKDSRFYTMIQNSEFTCLLNQGAIDKEELLDIFTLSTLQLNYINGSETGTGLIRFGSNIAPFDNIINKDNYLYKVHNTSFHED
ncbi:VirB4-like conjugal transfer ATPase, CD1110 family [Eubacterium sp.]|nr:hypothetical protein [Eubacterium sp.]MCR5628986.1 hypothetical protein [Eubacterium sp.]